MLFPPRLCLFLLAFLPAIASAQQPNPPNAPTSGLIYLDVVVTPKSGPPVADLEQKDFTLLDSKARVPINSFQAITRDQLPVEVALVVDAVNTGFDHVAFERSEIDKFLHADGGRLLHPTTLLILTDDGLHPLDFYSSDGNELSKALHNQDIGLRIFRRGHTIDDPFERFQISTHALDQILLHESRRPGRKLILWLSPGWPLFDDPQDEQFLDAKQQQHIFDEVVRLSNLLRENRITLYSVDPVGAADFAGRAIRWQAFLKSPNKPYNADWGNLALQVIATQSGGLALTISNDVAQELQRSVADANAFYELSFAPSLDRRHGEYHPIDVKVAKPGLTARTRQGYYVQP